MQMLNWFLMIGLLHVVGKVCVRVLRLLAAIFVSLAMVLGSALPAQAGGKFAAITVDARTGAVLYSDDANSLRHPASLTKMMTLYIVFQDLKAGRIRMSTPLKVSRRAAYMPPSKLGLKPGSTITVEQAIKALVIKSANDVAATVGENLGRGSEAAFALRMTRIARSIGMSRTTFKNASGLPNPAQVTTAKDMATLGLRLMRDYPQFYPYFRAQSFVFQGRVINSHNRLVGRFPGTDGIKTGYINASGFNLVTSTRRDEKRLVGVVLGARSSGRRNAFMMAMLTRAFAKAKAGNTIAAVAGSGKGAIDPLAKSNLKVAAVEQPESQDDATSATDAKLLAAAAEAAAVEEGDDDEAADAAPQVIEAGLVPSETTHKKKRRGKLPFAVKTPAEAPAGSDVEASVDTGADEGLDEINVASLPVGYSVQISSFKDKAAAKAALGKIKLAAAKEVKGKQSYTVAVKKNGNLFYRVVIVGFTASSAKKSCAKLSKIVKTCAVLTPNA